MIRRFLMMIPAAALGAALMFACNETASAGQFTLRDKNSTSFIDTQSQSGMSSWVVDGVDHMYQEWMWYGVGNSAETSLDTIHQFSAASDSNFDGFNETLFGRFSDGSLQFEVTWVLTGGAPGSNSSILSETFRVTNLTQSQIDNIRFFTYTDLDMGGGIVDDLAFLDNQNSIHQYDGIYRSELTHNPNFSRWEISIFPSLLNSLNDGSATTLSNSTTPLVGPLDIVQAFQYNFSLAGQGSITFGVQKTVYAVPEPGSIAMVCVGLLGVAGIAHRRRRAA